ncbi:MAG TPA: family 1 glycosylhydrolase [Candidatus Binataceae bacterium]|nr:family 1 glycosylhydrolase [Candidatus Binataceae bacterium]
MNFPKGFSWGTATAAHQVEGGNSNSDCWLLEHVTPTPFAEPSGDACDQYHRYREDIAMLAQLGFNSYRFSIEWARVEPAPGEFSAAALEHYRRVLAACHEHRIAPMVTLHHFTSPRWIAARGGWEAAPTADLFARYCERVARELGDLIASACTINELNSVQMLQTSGLIAPDEKIAGSRWRAAAARAAGVEPENFSAFPFCCRSICREVILSAHRQGAQALRAGRGKFPVGMTIAMEEIVAEPGGEALRDVALEAERPFLEAARADDFIGVQTYTRERFGANGRLGPAPGAELTLMGYEFRPQSLVAAIRRAAAAAPGIPIIVTESGIAATDDSRRVAFVQAALEGVLGCIRDGIEVRGYYYWSMLDNFEWIFGYRPTFGLIAVDRATQRRIVRPSAEYLGRIARANVLEAVGSAPDRNQALATN